MAAADADSQEARVAAVTNWLSQHGLALYAEAFEEHGFESLPAPPPRVRSKHRRADRRRGHEAGARRQVPLRAEQGAADADASAASASVTGASDSAAQAPPASYSSDVV